MKSFIKSTTNLHKNFLNKTNQNLFPLQKFKFSFIYNNENKNPFFGNGFLDTRLNSQIFYDNSPLIKKVIKLPGNTLILMPKKTGKTFNIEMIKNFLEFQIDKEGNIIKDKEMKKNTLAYKAFFGNENSNKTEISDTKNLKELKIANEKIGIFFKKNTKEFFGEYPVIHLNFAELIADTKEEFIKNFKNLISKEVFKFEEKYSNYIKNYNEDLKNLKILGEENEEKFIKFGLKSLVQILSEIFQKDIYILIDDFEAPLEHFFLKNSNNDIIEEVMDYVNAIPENLCKISLSKIVAFGKYNVSYHKKFNAPSEVFNIFSQKDAKFTEDFSVKENELENFIEKFGDFSLENNKEKEIKKAKEKYFSFIYFNRKSRKAENGYNLFSLLNYKKYKYLFNFWENNLLIKNLYPLFENHLIKKDLKNLLLPKEDLKLKIVTNISIYDYCDVKQSLFKVFNFNTLKKDWEEVLKENYFSYLYHMGIFTNSNSSILSMQKYSNEQIQSLVHVLFILDKICEKKENNFEEKKLEIEKNLQKLFEIPKENLSKFFKEDFKNNLADLISNSRIFIGGKNGNKNYDNKIYLFSIVYSALAKIKGMFLQPEINFFFDEKLGEMKTENSEILFSLNESNNKIGFIFNFVDEINGNEIILEKEKLEKYKFYLEDNGIDKEIFYVLIKIDYERNLDFVINQLI